ncbi:MAG: FAD-dependent oxidoreductase [Lentisphaeria bacterium]|nr:FAD-dependent oxidoreductase [Lentisphaeria bacterium]
MNEITLGSRLSTILWKGDVIVLGAGWGGMSAALSARARGLRVCLIETAPTLGIELSAMWNCAVPDGKLGQRILEFSRECGAPPTASADPLLCTLAFDQLASQSGIDAFVRVLPVRVVVGQQGMLRGVEVVGKSGRQIVEAATVIDATPGRAFARATLALPAPAMAMAIRRAYLARVPADFEACSIAVPASMGVLKDTILLEPAAWPGEALLSISVRCAGRTPKAVTLQQSMAILNEAVAHLRQNVQGLADVTMVDVAPGLQGKYDRGELGSLAGTGVIPLLEGTVEQEVLSGETLDLAGASRPVPTIQAPDGDSSLQTNELAAAAEQDLDTTELPAVTAILHEPRDIVVAGYGTAGAFAALSASEAGSSVVVLDPTAVPGGIGTAGRIHSYYHGLPGGMQDRLDEHTTGLSAATATDARGFHPVAKTKVLADALANSAADILSGHIVFGVVVENRRLTAVVSAAADGYHVFPCQAAIDGTGDGDLAAAAGAPMTFGRDGDGFPQPYSYTPTQMVGGQLRHYNYDAGWVDPTDTIDFSRAHFEGRARIWKRAPYTAETHYCTLASILGLRESRFLAGTPSLTFDDFLEGRTWPDSVCSSRAHHDNHAMDYAEESDWCRHHVVMFGLWRFLCQGDVPFRTFVPQELDGLLVPCRALAVDHDLHQLVRMQRDLQVFGEICGLAAARAIQAGSSLADVDMPALQAELRTRGICPKPAESIMDKPVPELFAELGGEQNGLAMWRLSRIAGDPSIDWAGFLSREKDPHRRFVGAVAAAVGKNSDPAVIAELKSIVSEHRSEPNLGIKSPAPCILAALALAELQAEGAAEALAEMLAKPDLDAAEILLLLKGFEMAGQVEGVAEVKRFLERTRGAPFEMSLWGARDNDLTSFRSAIEIRAVRTLTALGDTSEQQRIESCLQHPNLLVRRHARSVWAASETES